MFNYKTEKETCKGGFYYEKNLQNRCGLRKLRK